MFIQRKNFLSGISRIRVSEGRDLDNGLRLDRNEKVDVWPETLLQEVFGTKRSWFLSVYPESTKLYRKLATFHNITENDLLLTSGIDGGLKTLFEVMTEPGDLVGVVAPTYAMYQVYAKLFQVNLCEIPYTEKLEFGFVEFESFLKRKPVIFFLPNPNQPIESAFNVVQLEEFAAKTLAKNCLFVIDEAYHLFGCESGVNLIKKYENIVVARTFSKGFGVPSIRLGYLISNAENMNILSKTRFAHESNALSNAVAEYLLDHYKMVESYNARVIEARSELKSRLIKLGISATGNAGNFLLLNLGTEKRAKDFVEMLLSQKIYVKGPWWPPWSKYVTITLGPIEVMERFLTATKEFVRAPRKRQ
jgi:histidinol-phosphate aminotransferase